jgi:hypothetical protein
VAEVEHDELCPYGASLTPHTDAARHASDAVNIHLHVMGLNARGRWVAVSLRNGKSDGTLYDYRRDAIFHQLHEKLCAYVRIPPNGMNVCQAESFLAFNRKAHAAGWNLIDPEDSRDRQLIPRLTAEDQRRQFTALGK